MSRNFRIKSPQWFVVSFAIAAGLLALLLAGVNSVSMASTLELAAPVTREASAVAPAQPTGKSNIGDYVWYDANADGQSLGSETEYLAGIDGVLVNLYEDFNKNGELDTNELNTLTTTITGDNPATTLVEQGWCNFDVTAAGRAYFVQIAPSNFDFGGSLQGFSLTSAPSYPTIFTNTIYVILPAVLQDDFNADFGFLPDADLGLHKSDSPNPVIAGNLLTYTLVITNAGPANAVGVTVTDTLPAEVTVVTTTLSQGTTCSGSPLVCALGTLTAGGTATITVVVTVTPTALGTITNTATVGSHLAVGDTLTYTLVIQNHGPSRAADVVLTDTLPAGLSLVLANPTPNGGPSPYQWNVGTLEVGESATVLLTTTVTAGASSAPVNVGRVSATTPGPDLSNNPASAMVAVVRPAIAIAKTRIFSIFRGIARCGSVGDRPRPWLGRRPATAAPDY